MKITGSLMGALPAGAGVSLWLGLACCIWRSCLLAFFFVYGFCRRRCFRCGCCYCSCRCCCYCCCRCRCCYFRCCCFCCCSCGRCRRRACFFIVVGVAAQVVVAFVVFRLLLLLLVLLLPLLSCLRLLFVGFVFIITARPKGPTAADLDVDIAAFAFRVF